MLLNLVIIFLLGFATARSDQSVHLWGVDSHKRAALQRMNISEFTNLMKPILEKKMVVIFLEEDNGTNVFPCEKDRSPGVCYNFLSTLSPNFHYNNVENPVEALMSIAKENEHRRVDEFGKFEMPLECTVGKAIVVNFVDKRNQLEKISVLHDKVISKVTKDIPCKPAYMYVTTRMNPYNIAKNRIRRNDVALKSGYMFRQGHQFLIAFDSIAIVTNGNSKVLDIKSMIVTNHTSNTGEVKSFNVTLSASDMSVTFNITHMHGYFRMGNIVANGTTYRSLHVEATNDFSFYCGNATFYSTDGGPSKLKWNHLQLQAPLGYTKGDDMKFGEAWHCVGFFTSGILSGLFVAIIMLVIVFTGICWMMNINTMDRFDDPKGKTIAINVSE